MKKFNHAYTLGFSIDSDNPSENVTAEELLAGLVLRLDELRRNPQEAIEACGMPFDSFENETGAMV